MSKALKLILATAVLGGLGAFVWFLLQPDPQALLRGAQMKLMVAPSVRYAVDFAATGDLLAMGLSGATGTAAVTAKAATDADFSRAGSRATASTFSIGMTGAVAQAWSGESRLKDGVYYLRLDALEGVSEADAAKLAGTWYSSGRPYLARLLGLAQDDRPTGASDVSAMKQAVGNVDLFRVVIKLPDETIDGEKQWHFQVELNREAVAALLLKWTEVRNGRAAEPEEAAAAVAEVAVWGEPVGEVWIGKSDRKFRRVRLSSKTAGTGLNSELTLDFTRYGEPVSVEVPPDAEPFEAAIEEVLEGRLTPAGERVMAEPPAPTLAATGEMETTAEASGPSDSDGDGLTDSDEFLYNADPWNPDTDADGYADGVEVKNGKNPTGPGALFGFGLGD